MGKETSLKRILLVEDDPGLAHLVRKQLQRCGQEVEVAASGEAALEFLQRDRDVLMLADYQLGDMNAIELLKRLDARGLKVPFIMVTGQGSEFVAVESMKMGARDYVIKDMAFPGLLTQVVARVQEELEIEQKLKRIEQALRMEKTHLLNHIPDLVFQIDETGKILSLNPAVQTILGYPEKSLVGKSIYSLIYTDDVKTVRQDYRSVMKGQAILRHPIRFVGAHDQVRWLEGNIVAIFDESGQKACGISGIYQDITETRRANERLRRAKERISLLVDVSPNLIIEAGLSGRVLSMNRSAKDYFELREGTLNQAGLYLWDCFPGTAADEVRDVFTQQVHDEKFRMTLAIEKKDRSSHWLEMTISPISDDPGEVTGFLVTAWDVTQRVLREAQIQESLKREEQAAREAKILQQISLSAGSGVEIEPANVIRSSLDLLLEYLKLQWVCGYLCLSDGEVERIGELGQDPDGRYSQQTRRCLTCEKCRNTLIPNRIDAACHGPGTVKESSPGELFLLPLVHSGRVYGMLYMAQAQPDSLENVPAFLRSVSRCAGLAVANAIMLRKADGRLRSRMQQLEGFGENGGYSRDLREAEGLDAILESAVHVVRAKRGIILTRLNDQYGVTGEFGLDRGQHRRILVDDTTVESWRSFQDNESIFIEDIRRESLGPIIEGQVEQSLMCLPLRDADCIFGFMLILDPAEDFELRYMKVLESYARLAEHSIRVHSLIARAREMDFQLGRIRSAAGRLSGSADLPGFLTETCESVRQICSCRTAWIGLLTRDGKSLSVRGAAGRFRKQLKDRHCEIEALGQQDPQLAEILHLRQPQICSHDTRKAETVLSPKLLYSSRCCVPIQDQGHLYGMLCIYDGQKRDFTKEHIRVLEEICSVIGYALSSLELKRTLSESESLRQIILQSVNEALLVVDDGGTVISSNLAASELFAGQQLVLSGANYKDLFTSQNPICCIIRDWLVTRQSGLSREGWTELERIGRTFLSVESRQVMIEEVPCLLLTIQDLTFQKKMNASLEHAAKLSTAGRIAAQISHEINNPLTLISSQLQRMVRENQAEPEKLKHLLIHVDRISQLTRRFSDLQSKAPLTKRVCPFPPVLDNILVLVENSRPFTGVHISKQIEPDLPPVEIDSNKIMQVILNLLINAADACKDQKKAEIRIHVYRQSVRMESTAGENLRDYLVMCISDNGCGMSSEQMSHIFEPFFTSKESGHGTGLGLSVSLSIIDQHHGWIHADSEPGRGSSFSVFLPAREKLSRREIRDIENQKVYNYDNVKR